MRDDDRPRRYHFPVRTQFENLGDIEICIALLDAMRANGTVRVDRGAVPEELHDVLGLRPDELVDARAWWAGLLGIVDRRGVRRVLVLKPGGLVNPRNLRERLGFVVRLGLVAAARASGAGAVQCCASCGDLKRPWSVLERLKVRLLGAALPRDVATARVLHLDVEPVPDAALASRDITAPTDLERRRLVVSMRAQGAVDEASGEQIGTGVRHLANAAGLTPTVVVQVGRDDAMCAAIARGAHTWVEHRWDAARPESRREVFAAYAEAAVVVSNRLHVLLIARLLGASIVAVADGAGSKVAGALSASAVPHGVVTVADLCTGTATSVLEVHPATAAERAARDRLDVALTGALRTA